MQFDLTYDEVDNKNNLLLIDVRSEKEFFEATIPNAINIPIFNNEERATVGTLYKENGHNEAKKTGLEIVSKKLPQLMEQIHSSLPEGKKPLFFCWRGGMRSKTMATLYDLMYPSAYRLIGGYREYRKYILKKIQNIDITTPTFVLHGMTGVGKTLILDELKKMGTHIIDLEKLAGHRGSVFGAVGNINPVNQKQFDSQMYENIKNINDVKCIVIEAESKRIGKILIPDNVIEAKENGIPILVTASIETRVNRIIAEYTPYENRDSINQALKVILPRIPTEIRNLITKASEEENYEDLVTNLLQYYYDPRYQYSTDKYPSFFEVNSDNLEEATNKILNYINSTITNKTHEALLENTFI